MLEIKQGYVWLVQRILFIGIIGWILFSQVFILMQAKGNGMFPSIKDGDLILGFRLQMDYIKDDVVVYEYKGEKYIGRILGKENDVIMMDEETGTLSVNGAVQNGEILFPTYPEEELTYPYTVTQDSVFILGDYRTHSKDSRSFGCIKMEDVKAKVITILRRREL